MKFAFTKKLEYNSNVENVNELLRARDELTKERDDLLGQIVQLRKDILSIEIQTRNNEIQRETRKKEKIERELRHARAEIDNRILEIKKSQSTIDRYKGNIQREDELNEMKEETSKINKVRDGISKRLKSTVSQKNEVERDRDSLKNKINALEKETEMHKKAAEQDKKSIEELVRERELLNKSLLKANSGTEKQVDMVRLHEQSKKTLESEIQNYRDEAQKQRKIIYQLEKERDRYINEASDLTQKVLQHMEDVKIREMQIFDYKKKIAEVDTKLKQQQNLYEAVRSDRNLYSKNLIEAQDEITEMKRKLKIMTHQIDQLKEEISTKEVVLSKEVKKQTEIETQKDHLKLDLQKVKSQVVESGAYIESLKTEQRKLSKIISEADNEQLRQKKELDQIIGERDILGTQLVRRNDELALLYEKLKIQQSTLNKGEKQYNERLEDIRMLKLEIRKLRREKAILDKTVSNIDILRQEIYYKQRELLKERIRCKALEEELENPMNIHRWRKLEGSDPTTYEMIQKVSSLQKRLISKTEEVVEKELLIKEREKVYMELKLMLSRQPGPEIVEQVKLYQHSLRQKTKQCKVLISELNMIESQFNCIKVDNVRLEKEYQEVKKKYFIIKKKEYEKERKFVNENKSIQPQNPNQPRYTGGGFNFKQPTAKLNS
ncbi:Coiled-coil domain-containing protein 147 [Intoshia linei]|uniref:Coiled-coil domain-containing protein 147 n=1 Tax=Intoshia linei TaxID=1819745 RepID=A0A177AYB0_9BILA|nr:Coiled-coil domain-containing protein 147 [Intoshia linei]